MVVGSFEGSIPSLDKMNWTKDVKYLSLFSGVGGGDLGCQYLLGWDCLGYVEWDPYCVGVLTQRIEDGFLTDSPVFNCDVREWTSKGYAKAYKGMVDIITAGFPCQPFSESGKQRAGEDDRNMWPATREVIRQVSCKWVLLENVPGLLFSQGYFGTILGDLAKLGYDAKWGCLGANQVKAPHIRKRLWLLATNTKGRGRDAPSVTCGRKREGQGKIRRQSGIRRRSGWLPESGVARVVDGMAFRVDRTKAIGNGQVPEVVRLAWEVLSLGQ